MLNAEGATIRQGAPAKMRAAAAPRDRIARAAGPGAAEGGGIDTIGSDQFAGPADMKTSPDFFAIWGGISGIQHGFPLLISDMLKATRSAGSALPLLACAAGRPTWPSAFPPAGAEKGRIAAGYDADFALLDLEAELVLSNDDLLYRHQQGPYAGRKCQECVWCKPSCGACPVWADGQHCTGCARKG